MAQPTTFTRERVTDTAFELIRKSGWNSLSARAIARKLGSSTMPIYSHLHSLRKLESELRRKAEILLADFQRRPWTEEPLLNLAFGYIAFARDEKYLFRFLYLEKPELLSNDHLSDMKAAFLRIFGNDGSEHSALTALEPSSHEALIRHTWIYTHGLAVLVNSGMLGTCPDSVILRCLRNAGAAFYLWTLSELSGSEADTGGNHV